MTAVAPTRRFAPGQGLVCLVWLSAILLCLPRVASASAGFLLAKDGTLVVGRNLDATAFTPGALMVNKRGIRKESRSWHELAYGHPSSHPHLTWVSKYGSLTLNTLCRDFIDSGMNEAGLVIQEMSLVENRYPEDASKPCFFMMLWMQYVLDCFATVDEVLASAREVALDGWNWHFFVADASGQAAVIEFIDGRPVLTAGPDLPVAALCDERYAVELQRLRQFAGFGGERPVLLKNDARGRDAATPATDVGFVRAATLLQRGVASPLAPTDYGFAVLDELARDGTRWSCVFDLTGRKLRYRTRTEPAVKEVALADFDFASEGPALMLDIHGAADPSPAAFTAYSPELNRAYLLKKIAGWETVFSSNGATLDGALERLAGYAESTAPAGPAGR